MPPRFVRDRKLEPEMSKFLELAQRPSPTLPADIEATEFAVMGKLNTTEPQAIRCPHCGSEDTWKFGTRAADHAVQVYMCAKCRRKFDGRGLAYRKQTPAAQIGAALGMFYGGLSLADVTRNLEAQHGTKVDPSTVYRWVMRYTKDAVETLGAAKVKVGDTWAVDETVIEVNNKKWWLFDLIDAETRFLLATHFTESRTSSAAASMFRAARRRTDTVPKTVISDGLNSYRLGIGAVFDRPQTQHIVSKGFTSEINNNLIERFHGTIKERTKVMRGLKSPDSAQLILDGFVVDYNFFRPHESLGNRTPAEAAGAKRSCANWLDVVKGSCYVFTEAVAQ